MNYDTFVLPCRNLPFVDYPYESESVRSELIREWANNSVFKYSFGFLFSEHEPKEFSDYKIPIGDVIDGNLVTTKEIILTVASSIRKLHFTFDMSEVMHHLHPYYRVLGLLPYWGEPKYYEELKNGKATPRVLYGPHKSGGLRPNQRRLIVLDDEDNILFGPLQSA